MPDSVDFQILIDQAGYKSYPVPLQGYYKIKIKNIRLLNTGAQQYVIRMKSNQLQLENSVPTNDILFIHRDGAPATVEPIILNAQLTGWIDFTITDYSTGNAPVNFQYILLHCQAIKL